jgi:hypothetical protein
MSIIRIADPRLPKNEKNPAGKTSRGMRSLSVIHLPKFVCVNAVEQQAGIPAGNYTPINL